GADVRLGARDQTRHTPSGERRQTHGLEDGHGRDDADTDPGPTSAGTTGRGRRSGRPTLVATTGPLLLHEPDPRSRLLAASRSTRCDEHLTGARAKPASDLLSARHVRVRLFRSRRTIARTSEGSARPGAGPRA